MNVSFGSMIYHGNLNKKTSEQSFVEKEIEKIFNSGEEYLSDNNEPVSLCGYIENETHSDVFVHYKKDGNVGLRLIDGDIFVKTFYDDDLENAPSALNKNKKPLEILLDLNMPLVEVKDKIKEFAEMCKNYADNYIWQMIDKEKEDLDKIEKRDEAIADLLEEERFVEEFGTDKHN